jgi:hypothetical protein
VTGTTPERTPRLDPSMETNVLFSNSAVGAQVVGNRMLLGLIICVDVLSSDSEVVFDRLADPIRKSIYNQQPYVCPFACS